MLNCIEVKEFFFLFFVKVGGVYLERGRGRRKSRCVVGGFEDHGILLRQMSEGRGESI